MHCARGFLCANMQFRCLINIVLVIGIPVNNIQTIQAFYGKSTEILSKILKTIRSEKVHFREHKKFILWNCPFKHHIGLKESQ